MTRGFTLMEVLVASTILSIGSVALGSLYINFNQQRRLESQRVNDYVCSVSSMEQIVQSPPSCKNSFVLNVTGKASRPCQEVSIRLVPVPGISHLVLASLPMAQGKILQRLVSCQ